MKTEKFSKRLVINKTTVANLSENEMDGAKGGGTDIPSVCATQVTCEPESECIPCFSEHVKNTCPLYCPL